MTNGNLSEIYVPVARYSSSMTIPPIRPGMPKKIRTAAISGTINLGSFMRAAHKMAKILRLNPAQHILLRVNAEEVTILDASKRSNANVVLYIEGFEGPLKQVESKVAQEIMRLRGFASIPLISSIEKPAPVDTALEKYLSDMVLETNNMALQSIRDELCSDSNYPRRAGFEGWFDQVTTRSRLNDPEQQIIKFSANGSITIDRLDSTSLNQLRSPFHNAAHAFMSEQRIRPPQIIPAQYAATAFHSLHDPYGLIIQEENITMIKEIITGHLRGQKVVYLNANPETGILSQVDIPDNANVALYLDLQNFDSEKTTFKIRIRLQKTGARASLPLVIGLYLRPSTIERENAQTFFENIMERVNQELYQEFHKVIMGTVEERIGKDTSDEDRDPVLAQLAQIQMPKFQTFTWSKT